MATETTAKGMMNLGDYGKMIQTESKTTLKKLIEHVLSEMLVIQTVGFGLPVKEKKYDVRIQTIGHNMTLVSYKKKSTAKSARTSLLSDLTETFYKKMI